MSQPPSRPRRRPFRPANTPPGTDTYALGRSDADTRRLIIQHQLYGPFTRQFLTAAGITAGMTVLDVGSGAGDVALLLAELAGPRARSSAWTPMPRSWRWPGPGCGPPDGPRWCSMLATSCGWSSRTVDAVVGRWGPAVHARSGRAAAPCPTLAAPRRDRRLPGDRPQQPGLGLPERAAARPADALGNPAARQPGSRPRDGTEVVHHLPGADLQHRGFAATSPLGGGPNWPGDAYVAETVRSLHPFLQRPENVDLDPLESRLRAEVTAQDGIHLLPAIVGAWSHT